MMKRIRKKSRYIVINLIFAVLLSFLLGACGDDWHDDPPQPKAEEPPPEPTYPRLYFKMTGVGDTEEMARLVPPSEWTSYPGRAGTVIFLDSAALFHRGKVPLRERMTLFYAYASRRPARPDLCRAVHFRPGLAHLQVPLTGRQRASLDLGARP